MNDLSFLLDKSWRMNNLYRIIDKDGHSLPFKLNSIQQNVLDNIHNRNVILKARQVGMSTFSVLYMLDEALFNENITSGIVSYSLEHAQHILKKIIGHALDTLSDTMQSLIPVSQRSAREIVFGNKSILRVDTTLRGGTYQNVLISEFGKTCARNPLKAEEVITGTLESVPASGKIIIESTGEGSEGYFAEIVNNAHIRGNDDLSELDFKLFFFPWTEEKSYMINRDEELSCDDTDYFKKIEDETGLTLSKQQKNWYIKKKQILGEKVKQEFPSTIKEAFLSSSDAYYFQSYIEKAYEDKRIVPIDIYDAVEPVYVAMDIGVNDLTAITFFQVVHGQIQIIDYYEDNNKGVDFYTHLLLQQKHYIYKMIFLPHDSKKRDGIVVENTYYREFSKYFDQTATTIIVLKQTDKSIQISNAQQKFARCIFGEKKTSKLLSHMKKYRKTWSERYGKYIDEPYHGIESNASDSFLYAMMAVTHIEAVGTTYNKSLSDHKKLVDKLRHRI